jgi:hypothetical protein
MKILKFFLTIIFLYSFIFFPLSAQTERLSDSKQKYQLTNPAHRDFIKVSTDTLFACIDIFNYFTERKFESFFNNMKKAWQQRKFDGFDRLCDSLGSNPQLFKFLKDKKNERKSHFTVKLPYDSTRITFNNELKPPKGNINPPETQEVMVTCDCPAPCVVCYCPGRCMPSYLCLCFYDPSPGGIIGGGGGGGFFCNYFRGGKPCAVRPPDYVPKE